MRLIITSIIMAASLCGAVNAKTISGTATVTVANSMFSFSLSRSNSKPNKEGDASSSTINIANGVTINIPEKLESVNVVTLNGFTDPELITKKNDSASLTYRISIQDTPIFERDGKRYMLAMQNDNDVINSYGSNDIGYKPVFLLIETDKEFTLIKGKKTPAFLSYDFFS